MSLIKVTFEYEPDEGARDDDDEMGITSEEYERVTDDLMHRYGAQDINFEKTD